MNPRTTMFMLWCALLFAPPVLADGEEFFGIIESRPDKGDVGKWTIGGRSVEVDRKTELDEDNGPFVAGACVEVELAGDGKVAVGISTEQKRDCRN